MITISSQHSGESVGELLADDPEELAYALLAMAQARMTDDDMVETAGMLTRRRRDEVSEWLRRVIAALEQED